MQMRNCDDVGHVTALDQSERTPKSAHLNDNRGLPRGAPGGEKLSTNQNAPFQISIIRMSPKICTFLLIQMPPHTTTVYEGRFVGFRIKNLLFLRRLKFLYICMHIGSCVTIFGVISKHMGRIQKWMVRDISIDCLTRRAG